MRLGKLSPEELKRYVFTHLGTKRDEVKVGAEVGVDCGVFKSEELLSITSDPITAATSNLGKLAIYISSNDIAAAGAEPMLATFTLIVPSSESEKTIDKVMTDADLAAKAVGIEIIGGHTEWSDAVNRPIAIVTMIGKLKASFLNVEIGDDIVVTKTVGLEGTAILATDFAKELGMTEDDVAHANAMADMLDVLPESKVAMSFDSVCVMHDVTEGGVFGAISEMCFERGFGAEIDLSKIKIDELTARVCKAAGVSAYKLISSGSMIIVCKDGAGLVKELTSREIAASVIGKITSDDGAYAVDGNRRFKLSVEPDELMLAINNLEKKK